jgi:hypothetical protein
MSHQFLQPIRRRRVQVRKAFAQRVMASVAVLEPWGSTAVSTDRKNPVENHWIDILIYYYYYIDILLLLLVVVVVLSIIIII